MWWLGDHWAQGVSWYYRLTLDVQPYTLHERYDTRGAQPMTDERKEKVAAKRRITLKRERARRWYARNRERVNTRRRERYAKDMELVNEEQGEEGAE